MARSVESRAALILFCLLVLEGAWVLLNLLHNPLGFLRFLGFAAGRYGEPLGWLLAGLVTAMFVCYSCRIPSVRANLVKSSWLKLLALPMALAAGILEEAVFRRSLMDYMQGLGLGVALQIIASGLAFGAVHGVWGVFSLRWRAIVGPTVITGILGTAFAIVYVASGRSVASCVSAHFLIDALIEPGLVLAAVRGEFGRLRQLRAM